MFAPGSLAVAERVLARASERDVRIATVETCTAGLLSACLTAVPGASSVFDRGFVLYHACAKSTGLGVPEAISRRHGAVSAEVTAALAEGGVAHSGAGVAAAITGYAGPGGGNDRDPVGTVYVSVALRGGATRVERHRIDGDRETVRLGAVEAALRLLAVALDG